MKELNYEVLGWALKALSEKCFEAARQKKECQSVTGCGMDDDDLDRLREKWKVREFIKNKLKRLNTYSIV